MARSRGFTLIEMVMVVVIVGIRVTIMVPRFANTKEKALVTTMKSDLRNLWSGSVTSSSAARRPSARPRKRGRVACR